MGEVNQAAILRVNRALKLMGADVGSQQTQLFMEELLSRLTINGTRKIYVSYYGPCKFKGEVVQWSQVSFTRRDLEAWVNQ